MQQPKNLIHLGTPGSDKSGSPSFYKTDDGRYIVQGYKLTDPAARAQLVNFPADREDAVIVSQALVDLIRSHEAQ